MTAMHEPALPGMEAGRRRERVEWGIRTVGSNGQREVELRDSEDDARRVVTARDKHDLPYWRGRQPQIVSRRVVTYTTNWSAS